MPSKITTYRYGASAEVTGLRLGVARHLPRGIKKTDYAARGYFDLWLPVLAPSSELVRKFRHEEIAHPAFARAYRAEMKKAEPRAVIELVARLSRHQPLALGCFCEDPARCHRSLLQELLEDADKSLSSPDAAASSPPEGYASAPCYLVDSNSFREEFREPR